MRVTRIRKAGQRCCSERSRPRSGRFQGKLSVLCVEGHPESGQCRLACAGRWVGRVFARGRDKLIVA